MDTPNATSNDANLPGEEYPGVALGPSGAGKSGWFVRWTASTGSTNDDLWLAGRAGAPDRLVLIADHQTAGKGRLDRRWETPAGENLLVSVLFRRVPAVPHALTHAAALAIATACERVAGVVPDLKWPNDLLLGGRKLSGILSTAGPMHGDPPHPTFVVVGVGLNIGWSPEGAANLSAQAGRPVSRENVVVEMLSELDRLLALEPHQLHDLYRERLATLNREVRVELPNATFVEGRAIDVDPDGRLLVLDACAVTHRLDVGDIVHLR